MARQSDVIGLDKRVATVAAQFIRQARNRVSQGIEDSSAHSFRSLTQVIRDTTEGRPTIAAVRQSKSYVAAMNRLNELHIALLKIATNARVELYDTAYRGWWAIVPADTRRWSGTDNPTDSGRTAFRNSILHGLTLSDTLWTPIRNAGERLEQALVIAGSEATPEGQAEDLVSVWEQRSEDAIQTAVQIAIEDSMHRALYVAGRDVFRAELLEPDPSLGE
jgi:hypothetical protein